MFDKPILPNFLSHKQPEQSQSVQPTPQVVQQPQTVAQTTPAEDPLAALRGTTISSTTSNASETSEKKEEHTFSNEADAISADAKVIKGESLHDTGFSDIWYTPEDIAYVRDPRTRFALIPIETPDLPDFKRALEQGYTGTSSYSVKFGGDYYRVERIVANEGVQFNCRKMPNKAPEIEQLGFAPEIVKHLSGLGKSSGLLLFAGPTGQGKTTSASAIMKRYLETEGGFLFTIEDPPEMPLSGLYHAKNGGLGLCKQTTVENDQ
jgi:twitching motility protein PilT